MIDDVLSDKGCFNNTCNSSVYTLRSFINTSDKFNIIKQVHQLSKTDSYRSTWSASSLTGYVRSAFRIDPEPRLKYTLPYRSPVILILCSSRSVFLGVFRDLVELCCILNVSVFNLADRVYSCPLARVG